LRASLWRGFLFARVAVATLWLKALLRPLMFLFHGLLNALSGLLASLRARSGKVAVLCAMQVRPRVERSHIFRRLIWVGLPFLFRHNLSQGLILQFRHG
jgi:hypothetical protein